MPKDIYEAWKKEDYWRWRGAVIKTILEWNKEFPMRTDDPHIKKIMEELGC